LYYQSKVLLEVTEVGAYLHLMREVLSEERR
jgi:hypothetical protein